jgi:TonB family protein
VRAGAPEVSHPHLRQTIVPVYPPLAVAARATGTVLIEAIIEQTCRVTSATIVESIPLLDAAAIESVWKWRFEPPRIGGPKSDSRQPSRSTAADSAGIRTVDGSAAV